MVCEAKPHQWYTRRGCVICQFLFASFSRRCVVIWLPFDFWRRQGIMSRERWSARYDEDADTVAVGADMTGDGGRRWLLRFRFGR